MSSNSSNKEIIDILRVSRDLDVLRALSHNENIAASIKTKIVDRIDKLVSSSKKAEEETQKQQEKDALVDSCAMKIILICILAIVVLVTLASLG
ncbi:MAG: hypothetical protein MJZ75_06580 [Paludibacteraceae bacterium]|nr:hypothetical protein [Paludibacteraceae bacterium]